MKTVLYSKSKLAYALMIIAMLLPLTTGSPVFAQVQETVIIAPEELHGITGSHVDPADIFVQRVTFTNVENVKDIEVVGDKGEVIKLFPNKKYKAYVRDKITKENLGFITLVPKVIDKKVAVGANLNGEFLFYQNGRVFNKLSLAEEGKIYFYRQSKSPDSRPLILFIGEVQDGEFTYEDYVKVTDKIIELRR